MNKNIKTYKVVFDPSNLEEDEGIEFISIVENPAIQKKGLYFSAIDTGIELSEEDYNTYLELAKEKIDPASKGLTLPPCHENCKCEIVNRRWIVQETDEYPCEICLKNRSKYKNLKKKYDFASVELEQKIIAPILIPDVKIYRYNETTDEHYYIYFDAQTIKDLAEHFNRNPVGKINVDHKKIMADAYLTENWIVEDKEFDKTKKYHLDVPVGSWIGVLKFNKKEEFNDYIIKKEMYAFSIEGLLGFEYDTDNFEFSELVNIPYDFPIKNDNILKLIEETDKTIYNKIKDKKEISLNQLIRLYNLPTTNKLIKQFAFNRIRRIDKFIDNLFE
jgi:hypothetical protein